MKGPETIASTVLLPLGQVQLEPADVVRGGGVGDRFRNVANRLQARIWLFCVIA
jgi:hypothetical protein